MASVCAQVEFIVAGKLSTSDSALFRKYIDSATAYSYHSPKRLKYVDSALTIDPKNAYLWQQRGMPLYKLKKYEAGERFLDSAVKYDAASYIDYRGFMKCIFQKKMHDAIADFHAAKYIIGAGAVMDHSYDFYLGLCYLQLTALDSAEYYLVKSITDKQKAYGDKWVHFLDLFYLGVVYYEKESYVMAVETFDKAINLYAEFSDAKYYKARALFMLNKMDEAIAVLKDGYEDFKAGYTINEDNAVYETYPYQVSGDYFSSVIKALDKSKR